MTLEELVEAASIGTSLGGGDSAAAHVIGHVNRALRQFSNENPGGWDYAVRYIALDTVDGTADYTYETLAALVEENLTRGAERYYPVNKIAEVDVLGSGSGTVGRCNIERGSVRALRRAFDSTGTGPPQWWAAEGRRLWIYPIPGDVYTLDLRVLIGEVPLEAGEEPLAPAFMHEAIADLARARIYDELQDVTKAVAARSVYKEQLVKLFGYERPVRGLGFPSDSR